MNLDNISLDDANWLFDLYKTSPIPSPEEIARMNNIHLRIFDDRFKSDCNPCVHEAYIKLLEVAHRKVKRSKDLPNNEELARSIKSLINKITDDARPKPCSACKQK
jgi:hypothetical protein